MTLIVKIAKFSTRN